MPNLDHLPIKLDFEGTNNFRDMGGYPTTDGSKVKRGLLFRSDHLGNLTDADQLLLGELGIKTVVDFRRQNERDEILDRIDNPAIKQLWLPVEAEGADVQKMRRSLESGEMNAASAHRHLVSANREFIQDFSGIFKTFIHLLLDENNYPIAFHCTAGKDRAGFAAALSLLTAGASIETVFHDYLATNHCTANYVNGILEGLQDMSGVKTSPDAVRTLMQVQPEFLQTAFDTMIEDYGSVEQFFEQALGIDSHKRAQIQSILIS